MKVVKFAVLAPENEWVSGVAVPGAAHVPSPRQKVDDDAPVPELSRLTERLPLEIFAAFVVSVVALVAKLTPFVFVQMYAPVPVLTVQSPPAVNPPKLPELLNWICRLVPPGGEPPEA